jgi:hypothetical protein
MDFGPPGRTPRGRERILGIMEVVFHKGKYVEKNF